jgi:hypothetical protein
MQDELIRFDKKIKLLFIDFETANLCLSHRFNLPWQMATVKTVGGEMQGQGSDTLIDWGNDFKFSKGAEKMAHSYSEDRMKAEGVAPKEAFDILSEGLNWCDGIAGHNILGFDVYLIRAMYERMGRKCPDILGKKRVFDTFAIAKGVLNNIPYQKEDDFIYYQYKMLNTYIKGSKTSLSKVAAYYDIPVNEKLTHDGVYDLAINIQVWNKLKYQVEI